MNSHLAFPADFVWGAATSAYQIEGSPLADGAGLSNWHRFTQRPGSILNGDTGERACDHYRRFAEDIGWMREIGLKAYRFSIAWGRVLPEGRGKLNPKGLDFYLRLTEALTDAGIDAYPTLFHWDLPAALEALGGWTNRDCAAWFADYATAMFRALEGRIHHWATLNEPWVVVHEGYVNASHPPAERSLPRAVMAAHNLLRAHGLAVQAGRAEGARDIGLVVNLEPKYAASDSPADRAAMARAHAWMNRQFLDPVLLGRYPEELAEILDGALPGFAEADLALIREPIDWLGVNYYSRSVVRAAPAEPPFRAVRVEQPAAEHTAMGWEVFPEGLTDCLLWVKRRYGDIPLFITENGAAFDDPAPVNGRVADPRRVAFLQAHLRAARDALRQDANLKGYFAWSLLDNFEWAFGYARRFGLIYVDFDTQTRTLKDSARFYREVINGAPLDG